MAAVDRYAHPLSRADKLALAAEVIATYTRVRVVIARNDLPTALRALRRVRPTRSPSDAKASGLRFGRAVTRTLRLLPMDSRCLFRALVLSSILARRGL